MHVIYHFPHLLPLSIPFLTSFINALIYFIHQLPYFIIYQSPYLLNLSIPSLASFTNGLISLIHQFPYILHPPISSFTSLTRYHVPHVSPFTSLFVYLIVTRVPLPSTTLWLPNSRSMSRADRASEARAVVAAVWWRGMVARYRMVPSYGGGGVWCFLCFFFLFLFWKGGGGIVWW